MINDNDIQSRTEDVLGRTEFANNIANLIANRTDNESFCIALTGAWGSGKTSVLHLIDESFTILNKESQSSKIITISFNPWRYSGEDELMMYFFNEIASSLDKKLTTKAELVKNFFKTHTEKLGTLVSAYSGDPTNSGQTITSWLSGFLKRY